MNYFLDTEFNGFGGELISLALVCEDGREIYLATKCERPVEWVKENVLPIIDCEGAVAFHIELSVFGLCIAAFLRDGGGIPTIVADWPDDIKYFCQALITGPGEMVNLSRLQFQLRRVDAYPTELPGAVQHCALWDARALQAKLTRRGLPPGVHQP